MKKLNPFQNLLLNWGTYILIVLNIQENFGIIIVNLL